MGSVGPLAKEVQDPSSSYPPEARSVSQGEDGGGESRASTGKVLDVEPVRTVEA